MENKSISIDLLRHGETTAGASFVGSTDVSLTKTGWQQMQNAVPGNYGYDAVISSPLKRCSEFAHAFSIQHGIPLVIEENFREMDFGDWEGHSSEKVWEDDQDALLAFWQDPIENSPTNGENIVHFHARVMGAFTKMLKEYESQHVLFVSHVGTIRSILVWLMDASLRNTNRININQGGMSRIRVAYDDKEYYPVIEYINRL